MYVMTACSLSLAGALGTVIGASAQEVSAESAPIVDSETLTDDAGELQEPFIAKRQYAAGLAALTKRIEKEPENGKLYYYRGKLYFSFCNYRKGIEDLSKSYSLTKNPEALLRKAIALCRIGSMLTALETFSQVADLQAASKTPDLEVTAVTARALLEMAQYPKARALLKAAVDSKTELHKSSNIRYLYSQALSGLNDKVSAIAQLNKSLEYNPDNYEALVARAANYLALKKPDKAIVDAKKATTLNDKSIMGNFYLAQAYFDSNDLAKARDAINNNLIASGKHPMPEAVSMSAQIALRQGDLPRAAKEGTMAVQLGFKGNSIGPMISRQITTVDAVTGNYPNIIATPHFLFYSDIPMERLQYHARFAESFIIYVDTNLIKLKGNFPRAVFMLKDKLTARKFLSETMGFKAHVHGVYLAGANAVVTYDGAGAGTIMHELMHTVLAEEKKLEYWAEEGIPCLFDKCFGYFENSAKENNATKGDETMYLKLGYPEVWYPKWMGGKDRTDVSLVDVVNNSKHANDSQENRQRQVALFLCKNDKLKTYLGLVESGDKKGYPTFFEATFEESLDKLAPKFTAYMQEIDKSGIAHKLPETEIFNSKAEFEKFRFK